MKHLTALGAILITSFLFVGCATQSTSQTPNGEPSKADLIAELLDEFAEFGQFNGSVLVADSGEVIFKKAYGMANMEWDISNQTDTKFRLASVSKQFTAMLVVQLAAENKIDLQAPISTYLPDFPKDKADIITAHHLLTHSSGLPSYTNFSNYRQLMNRYLSPQELVSQFADSALVFEPGFRCDYSNSGYALLGYLIESITGESYGEVIQNKIFEPLGMNHSGYDSHRDIIKNRAEGYYKNGMHYLNASYIDMSVAYAAGGLYSSVEDLFLWDQALYTEKLVPKEYRDLIFQKHITMGGTHYGYGWDVGIMYIGENNMKVKTIGHDGVINGFTSSIIRIPESQSSVIFLNNTGGAPLRIMSKAIIAILKGQTYNRAKQSIAEATYKMVKSQGLEAALTYYEENAYAENYYLSEEEMNLLGYEFLQAGQIEEAAAFFKSNIEAFPTSFNAYDSYAESLMVLGDTVKSIEYYEKSVKMNPQNENGIMMLEKLRTK